MLQYLSPVDGGVYIDCTFGAGGYSTGILDAADCSVIAFDRDITTFVYAEVMQKKYGDRFRFEHTNFGDFAAMLPENTRYDGIVFDFGMSSMQIDNGARGFSFQNDGALDMRMDTTFDGMSAYNLVNELSEGHLADIIFKYGDEPGARRIAKAIVERRKLKIINTTFDLADIVRSSIRKTGKIDAATKTFQALRIAVNDELTAIEKGLEQTINVLKKGGRLVAVSFHALEDRLVKNFLRTHSAPKVAKSKYTIDTTSQESMYNFTILTPKVVVPSAIEIAQNVRSRSAKLRAAMKL